VAGIFTVSFDLPLRCFSLTRFQERAGLLAVYTGNTETRFSVNSLEGGGYNFVGLPIGVPLIIGSFGAIRLVLQVKAVSG
jgi:hypothetical protein